MGRVGEPRRYLGRCGLGVLTSKCTHVVPEHVLKSPYFMVSLLYREFDTNTCSRSALKRLNPFTSIDLRTM